jgi:methionine transaminase
MPKYSHSLTSKLPRTGTTIFTIMSKLAAQEKAINLSQGFPNFEADERLIKLVGKYMKKGHNQYSPMPGMLPLRQTISDLRKAQHGVKYNPESEVTITAGATQAIFTAITALVREGDEVMVFTPAYDCYVPALELAGANAVYIQMKAPHYKVDWEEVRKKVSRRTRMIIINTPHNPTGTVWSKKDLEELDKITSDTDIIVLSDEVYEHIVFDRNKHHSCSGHKGLVSRSLVVGSFGKTFHVTGWKMGYICGPEELMSEFRKVHQYNVFSCNTPVQLALAKYMEETEKIEELSAFYQEKRDYFISGLKDSAFTFEPAAGTYFQVLNYGGISQKEDTDIAVEWTKKHKIASIPLSVFYHYPIQEQQLRFCFAKDTKTLKRALEVLNQIQ